MCVEVLILILMEHAQRFFLKNVDKSGKKTVLILILMEHAQRFRIIKKEKDGITLS